MPLTVTQEQFLDIAKRSCEKALYPWDTSLESLLLLVFSEPLLLPKKGKIEINSESTILEIQEYLEKFIGGYFAERSKVFSLKSMNTTPDPAVDEVLKAFGEVHSDRLEKISINHRLSMAAENLIGSLLERYIASVLEGVGWVWASGSTLRAIDFFKPGIPPTLLQVKNRSNSENSSSSAIRIGTTIEKWYRIKADSGQTNWEKLQRDTGAILSEEDFYAFIVRCAKKAA